MAFQGQQGPDMISLALNLMQMRRENEFNERKFKLEEAKLAQQAQLDAIQAQRDQAEWILNMKKSQLDFDNAMTKRETEMGPTLNAANDPRIGMPAQQAAANQVVRGINEQIAAGRDPEMVGGTIGAAATGLKTEALDTRDVKDEDAERAKRYQILQEARQDARDRERERRGYSAAAEEIIAFQDRIEIETAKLSRMPIGSPAAAAQQRRIAALQAESVRKRNAGMSDGFYNAAQFIAEDAALQQEADAALKDLLSFRELVQTNPEVIGLKGTARAFVAGKIEQASDVSAVLPVVGGIAESFGQMARRSLVSDGTLSDSQRARLERDMGITSDGTLQARTDAKALESRIAYIITTAGNKGRFSQKEYERNLERYALAGTASSAQAARNINTAIADMTRIREESAKRAAAFGGVIPGADGGFVGAGGESILSPSGGTPLPSIRPDEFEQIVGGQAAPVAPAPRVGKSGLPLLDAPAPRSGTGFSADDYDTLNPAEKAEVLEQILNGAP